MSKLVQDLKVPQQYNKATFADIIRAICGQVNQLSEGGISSRYQAQASMPASSVVAAAVGDVVFDSNATVRGSVAPGLAASYVRIGWICTAPGSPGTWQEMRLPTGA